MCHDATAVSAHWQCQSQASSVQKCLIRPNQASFPLINEKDKKNPAIYPSEQAMEKIFYLKDPGENMKILDQAWTRIKSQ